MEYYYSVLIYRDKKRVTTQGRGVADDVAPPLIISFEFECWILKILGRERFPQIFYPTLIQI